MPARVQVRVVHVRKLGKRQLGVLEGLERHGQWPLGWAWGTMRETEVILDSLYHRGLVSRTWEDGKWVYRRKMESK